MRGKSAERRTGHSGPIRRQPAATSEAADAEPAVAARPPARSGPGRLAGEVERVEVTTRLAHEVARLEAELAATQARVVELEAHALHDPLTGLLNRRGFERELARAAAHMQRYGGRLVLVYLDLDGFKPVNDQHGHAAGDAVLQAVAAVLRSHVRVSDLLARLGGDEFAVLLWNLADADAAAKATTLETMIAATLVHWGEAEIAVGASAGTAPLADPADAAAALARADAAMYARKRSRRETPARSGRGRLRR
ncbi:GGDEF domain-containing protein [Rhodoplanes sp.]|uniref:GGDEF domain-containing protein n=1 Tax=Rhodoplanes sp. TaxID=1968906 RepID=UPI0025DFB30E|nr:GGDEF domain-containing protein [Rhodoplanes sp.]